jgi:hypothetical protein
VFVRGPSFHSDKKVSSKKMHQNWKSHKEVVLSFALYSWFNVKPKWKNCQEPGKVLPACPPSFPWRNGVSMRFWIYKMRRANNILLASYRSFVRLSTMQISLTVMGKYLSFP